MFNITKATYNGIETFPTKIEIGSMSKAGYKFKIDNKPVTKKNLEALLPSKQNNNMEE